jgi:hypothetical protein
MGPVKRANVQCLTDNDAEQIQTSWHEYGRFWGPTKYFRELSVFRLWHA